MIYRIKIIKSKLTGDTSEVEGTKKITSGWLKIGKLRKKLNLDSSKLRDESSDTSFSGWESYKEAKNSKRVEKEVTESTDSDLFNPMACKEREPKKRVPPKKEKKRVKSDNQETMGEFLKLVIKGAEAQINVIKAIEELKTQEENKKKGMKAKELDIPTFSGETGQYQEWKRQAKANTDNMDLEDGLKNLL